MRSSLLLIVTTTATLAAQKTTTPEARLIDAPNARIPISLGSPAAVRQLPGGRLLVNDTQRRQLLLVDQAFASVAVVADSMPGLANSYGAKAGGLVPFLADSTLFVDPDGLSMFVIDPAGKIARVASVPRSQDAAALGSNTAGIDARGHLVYRGLTRVKQIANGGLTTAQFPDSISIERIDLVTRRVDTAGYFKVSKTNMIVTETEHGMNVAAEVNPVQTVDDWAVLSNGMLAIVRGQDYRVDFVDGSSVRSGAKIPFIWRPLPDEEKLVVLDSAKRQIARMFAGGGAAAMMAMHGGGGATPPVNSQAAANAPPPVKLVSPSALPDYWPPFSQNAARADADGRLWVRTTAVRAGAIGGPIYDVIDDKGTLVDRVQVPAGRTIVGFGKDGIVYLAAREGNGAWLERTTTAKGTNTAAGDVRLHSDSSTAKFVGDWEGSYRSDHASGSIAMSVARDTAWKVTLEMTADSQLIPNKVRDFRVDGNDVYFTFEAMDMACKTAATLENGVLTGEIDCGHAKLALSLKKRAK